MTAPVTLAQRLEHGWALIDEATDAGDHAEAQRLTDHFLNLLEQYQREQDALHWEIAAQHEWRASTTTDTKSAVQRGHGAKEFATAAYTQSMELRA